MEQKSPFKPKCCECWYFTFLGFTKMCSHPDKARILIGGPINCKQFQNYDPVIKRNFKEKVTHDQLKLLLEG